MIKQAKKVNQKLTLKGTLLSLVKMNINILKQRLHLNELDEYDPFVIKSSQMK